MAQEHDIVAWVDLPAALGLLTRLPVQVDIVRVTARGARAAWAWPLVGVVTGTLAALVGAVAVAGGLPPTLAAGLALAVLVMVTGALHEDGLADCADGFWGGQDRDRRLAIMRDSRIGAYGVIALVLSLGLRWVCIAVLVNAGALWPALIVAGVLSRVPMVVVAAVLPHARPGGLSRAVGRPPAAAVWLGLGLAVSLALALAGWAGLAAALAAGTAGVAVALVARAKIGGQTGDVLGAAQQLSEIAVLCALVSAAG